MIGNTTKGKSFGGTVKYVLGKQGAQLIYTNVFAGLGTEVEPEAIAAEMTETARRNRTNQPVYHLSVSPAESDQLSISDWVSFSQDLLQELTLEKNQVVVVLHNDEDYPSGKPRPHAHFVINLVDDTGKRANTSWDYRKTERALRHLERCYGLTSVQFSWQCQEYRLPDQAEHVVPEQLEKPFAHQRATFPERVTGLIERPPDLDKIGQTSNYDRSTAPTHNPKQGGNNTSTNYTNPMASEFKKIEIKQQGELIELISPYDEDLVIALKKLPVQARQFNDHSGSWKIAAEHLKDVREIAHKTSQQRGWQLLTPSEPELVQQSGEPPSYKKFSDIVFAAREDNDQLNTKSSVGLYPPEIGQPSGFDGHFGRNPQDRAASPSNRELSTPTSNLSTKSKDETGLDEASPAWNNRTSERAGHFAGKELEYFGQSLQRSGDQEVDGIHLAGAGLSLLGSGARIADAIAEALALARERADRERLNKIIDNLEATGERAQSLEQKIKSTTIRQEQVQEPLEGISSSAAEKTVGEQVNPERINKVINDLEAAGERAQNLETKLNKDLQSGSPSQGSLSFSDSDKTFALKDLASTEIKALTDEQVKTTGSKGSSVSPSVSKFEVPDPWLEADSEAQQPDLTAVGELQEADRLTESQPHQTSMPSSGTNNAEHPLADATELLDKQITFLEQQFDGSPDPEYVPIKIDREVSLNKQLDQIEAAIHNLNSRMDKLEEAVKALQAQRETASEVAESLVAYAKARAEVYGTNLEKAIPTTMGTIEVSDQGNYIAIHNNNSKPKFEVVSLGGKWEVINNELSSGETERLINLPQSPQAYRIHVDGRDLVNYLQRSVPTQFLPNSQGTIHWKDQDNEFNYKFTISAAEGSQLIKGIDKESQTEIFSAIIQPDKSVKTSKSEIPTERISDLLKADRQPQQQKAPAKSQEQEITQ